MPTWFVVKIAFGPGVSLVPVPTPTRASVRFRSQAFAMPVLQAQVVTVVLVAHLGRNMTRNVGK